ncbi:ADP-ribosylglycohydrolase family protein [Nocardia sp. NPDC005978]|uniref:ADP-ribosylglycohydrolase family protein n=1 Tax=Nocardia sp. NPDC005978 TaxID=3156725 RepID=UPI0033B17B86
MAIAVQVERAYGSLIGLAIGDAFGCCYTDALNHAALRERSLLAGPWLWSDDTEMACSVFAVLRELGRIDQDALAKSFAAHYDIYRWYGPGTGRILRLIRDRGGDWRELAGRARDGRGSWGNGAAMRVAPVGAYFAGDLDRVVREAAASAVVTHAHAEGVAGAVAVAVAAALGVSDPGLRGEALLAAVAEHTPGGAVREGISAAGALGPLADIEEVIALLGNGSRTSAQDTVPFCLWMVAEHGAHVAEALWRTAAAGGDMDTTCAIVGGILGARLGVSGLPDELRERCEPLPEWIRQ